MEAVLECFKNKLVFEDRKVILFLNNATCHPKSMIGHFSQMKIIISPKNITLRLQPLDAGIIQNFRVKYQKRLVKYVPARIQEDASTTQIAKGVDVLGYSMATRRVKKVSNQRNYQNLFWEIQY